MEDTSIQPISIEDEMKNSYLDYAMSVIIGRALPDVRDGLKPVHRRILFAMLGEGLVSNKKYSKCAGVVGEVLKRLHPHGDTAVYDSLVRMAQPWNLRYPLIDGQGNFGSIDGDSAAAYRYTECRMKKLAEELLSDIEKETVDFVPNFDESSDEPLVLPTKVPNLLINGTEGIAVGMASKIPPHNLTEVVSAAIHLVQNPEATVLDLMQHIPGPDFPTGGIIYGTAPLRQIYETGRGLIQVRGKLRVEDGPKGDMIIVDEVPYQTNKAKLVERIAELVHEKKIEGISKLRDESDRTGMRVVVELKRDAVTEVVINQLYQQTPLQKTFGTTLLAVVSGRPKVMSLKEILNEFLKHRRDVIVRRTRFDLSKARARLHIVTGLEKAISVIDLVIAIIRASENTPAAREELMRQLDLSEIQAQHILDMPLKKLTTLERNALENERLELEKLIAELSSLLNDKGRIDFVIVEELTEIREKFGDARRTVIEEDGAEIEIEDLIPNLDMVVSISHKGYAKRCSTATYRAQRRGGKGLMATKKDEGEDADFVTDIFTATNHSYLLVFTDKGKIHWLKVYKLPDVSRVGRGRAIVNLLQLEDNEKVSAILPVIKFEEGQSILFTTKLGIVKRVSLMDFANVRKGGIRATSIDEGDSLIGVTLTAENYDCILTTKEGMAIRFPDSDVREVGRTARGVRGIMVDGGDIVVNAASFDPEKEKELSILTVTSNGFGKRTSLEEYRKQSRGGKGVIDIKTTDRNGHVAGSVLVSDSDDAMIITTAGKVIRTKVSGISCIGRNTQGVNLITLDEGEIVTAITRVISDGDEEEGVEEVAE